jgi:hypothetical protein
MMLETVKGMRWPEPVKTEARPKVRPAATKPKETIRIIGIPAATTEASVTKIRMIPPGTTITIRRGRS